MPIAKSIEEAKGSKEGTLEKQLGRWKEYTFNVVLESVRLSVV